MACTLSKLVLATSQCQVSARSILSGMRPVRTFAPPTPTPYVDPFPPKVTQCHPRPGSPTRAVFAWWGGRLRESAGSHALSGTKSSSLPLVANC